MRRYLLPFIIFIPLTAVAAAPAADMSAEADRILRGAAEEMGAVYSALDERTVFLFSGMSDGSEFEEYEILERLARSEGGREAVAEACRRAIASEDPYLRLVAYSLLAEAEPDEAATLLPGFYESMSDSDIFMLMTVVETALSGAPEEGPAPEVDALYGLLERDLHGDDAGARVKAAKVLAVCYTDRARTLAESGLESPDPEVRRWCVMGVVHSSPYGWAGESGEELEGADVLKRALADEDATVRAFAARKAGTTGDPAYIPPLLDLLADKNVSVRRGAAASLAALLAYAPGEDKKGLEKKLKKALKAEPDGVTRCHLAEAYASAGVKEEGCGKYLNDDGYWAFFSGNWNEKDLDGYFESYSGGDWGGG